MAFPSHTEAQGARTSSLIVMGKVIGYETKVKSSTGIPGTEIAAASSTDVITEEGRLRIQAVPLQGSRTDPAASQQQGCQRAEAK